MMERKTNPGEESAGQRVSELPVNGDPDWTTLLAGTAHDLNNLLASLLGRICLLQLETQAPAETALVEMACTVEEAAALTQQIMSLARGDRLPRTRMNLNQSVLEALRLHRPHLPATLSIELALEGGLWPVRADAHQMVQVVANLCLNAAQAMDGAGRLAIETTNVPAGEAVFGPQVRLAVADTGPGMSPDVARQALEPFFTTKPRGHGLGLPAVAAIVRQHGGSLAFDTGPARGCRVIIHLPAHPDAG